MAGADATQSRSTNQPQMILTAGDMVAANYQTLLLPVRYQHDLTNHASASQ
jgi:hypothetical protein